MINYFYDTEFIEDGNNIDLISIGIVSDRGDEYYAINKEINVGGVFFKIRRHKWLMENVIPHLPLIEYSPVKQMTIETKGDYFIDETSPFVKSREVISSEVSKFLGQHNEPIKLWAYYGAYDHVVLSWLWGPMINHPKHVPMYTNDLMQYADMVGVDNASFPLMYEGNIHNALDDAKWNKQVFEYIKKKELERKDIIAYYK